MSWWKIWQRAQRPGLSVPEILPPRSPPAPRYVPPDPQPMTSMGPGCAPVIDRPRIFDPALKHFRVGLLPEDPRFDTAEKLAAWLALQRRVMAHVLGAIAESPAASQLVLRGSALLCAWFPASARPPKDLDFVVVPETLSISDPRATQLLEAVVTAVVSRECEGVELRREEVAQDGIWTYDRVPGTRLVFRWTAPGMPWGATQLDFVFGEPMPAAAEALDVALTPKSVAPLQVAPKDLSLAWKLLWLHSDMHPRGKDLYDAVLLAEDEDTSLSRLLLDAVFQLVDREPLLPDELTSFSSELEWVGFEAQDPITVEAWKRRLGRALRTALEEDAEPAAPVR